MTKIIKHEEILSHNSNDNFNKITGKISQNCFDILNKVPRYDWEIVKR